MLSGGVFSAARHQRIMMSKEVGQNRTNLPWTWTSARSLRQTSSVERMKTTTSSFFLLRWLDVDEPLFRRKGWRQLDD